MSWIQKLLPPKIKRAEGVKKSIPEGLWVKCPACEAVLYSTDLDNNQITAFHPGAMNHSQANTVDSARGVKIGIVSDLHCNHAGLMQALEILRDAESNVDLEKPPEP